MKNRDSQRSRVYEAESAVRLVFDRADQRDLRTIEIHGSSLTLPIERRFASLESVQTYVDRVLALNWVRATWTRARVPVRVRARSGTTAAHYERDCATIAVPVERCREGRRPTGASGVWALRELVLLHELAHHLDPDDPETVLHPAHGGDFTARYLALVTEVVGAEAGFLLRTTMLDHGVTIA